MTDSWKTNKEMKRDNSGDRVSRFFGLKRDYKTIMKKFALMILVIGLVGVFSGVASGQTLQDGLDAYDKKNYKKALEILKPLAEQGDAKAQFNLGGMYGLGKGVIQDYVEAHKWANVASANGHKKAIELRDNLEVLMTPSQIAEAQKLAREWVKNHSK